MNEVFTFVTQLVVAYLLLGCLLVFVISLSLRLFSLNAAARHKIWLAALLVLVLAPALTLLPALPSERTPALQFIEVSSMDASIPGDLAYPDVSSSETDSALQRAAIPATLPPVTQAEPAASLPALESASLVIAKLPLAQELLVFLILLWVLAVVSKSVHYVRSLLSLKSLIDSSNKLEGAWLEALSSSMKTMGMRRPVELRHSTRVSTPSTCGVLRPHIILPSNMLREGSLVNSRFQILQHELAHIKRNDPLVAGLQAFVWVFLFWHPAINYVNRKIRYEREIACDDWVLSKNQHGGNSDVRAYAFDIVDIAQSLGTQGCSSPAHSVACVNQSRGLEARIRLLLDQQADHSTSVNLVPNVWVASLALGFLFLSSSLLPKLPSGLLFKGADELTQEHTQELPSEVTTSFVVAVETPEEINRDIDPIAITIESLPRQLADYEVPQSISDFKRNPELDEFYAVRSRAASIGSAFGAKEVELSRIDAPVFEPLMPPQKPVATVSLAELVNQQTEPRYAQNVLNEKGFGNNESIYVDDLSRAELADEIQRIELEIYRVFNTVTDRDDLKMRCSSEIELGSFIKKTRCEPEFLRSARSFRIRESVGSAGTKHYNSSIGLSRDMQAEYDELAAEILLQIQSNTYLRELYQALAGLRGRMTEMV